MNATSFDLVVHFDETQGGAMPNREIPASGWADFLDSFSHRHQGWRVDLLVRDDGDSGSELIAGDEPLREVALAAPDEVDISLGDSDQPPLTKVLRNVHRVSVDTTRDGLDRELAVEGEDGAQAVVRFRIPAPPEAVDGYN